MALAFKVDKSTVSGMGIFDQSYIPNGKILFAVARIKEGCYKEMEPGNFINHSETSNNVILSLKNNKAYVFASRNIHSGEEILLDYGQGEKELSDVGIPIDFAHGTNFLVFKSNPEYYQHLYDACRKTIKGADKRVGHVYLMGKASL